MERVRDIYDFANQILALFKKERQMLIERFHSIKNIGRLVDCRQKGPKLNRYNFFFAENGRGKTTLCAILRSLQTGKREYIDERTTVVPGAGEPEVILDTENGLKDIIYKEGAWSKTVSEIVIFDETFIAQNVHAGEHVSHDQRSNLLKIIIGKTGIQLAEKISELDGFIRNKNANIRIAKEKIEQHLSGDAVFENFLNLREELDIDSKIETKRSELEAAKQAEEIEKHSIPVKLVLPDFPENFETMLSKTLDDVSEDAESKLKEQIERHEMHIRGHGWLSEGLNYLRNDICPFCGQGTKGLDLVDAYKQFFSESYNSLINDINQLKERFMDTFSEEKLARHNTTLTKNEANFQFWKQFVVIEVKSLDYENVIAVGMRELRTVALILLEKKLESPLTDYSPDDNFNVAKRKYDKAIKLLQTYNDKIDAAEIIICERKEIIKSSIPESIMNEIKNLELIKLRYDPKIKSLCNEYETLVEEKNNLNRNKDEMKKRLDDYTDEVISSYEQIINKMLKDFGAGYSITNSKKTYKGGKASSSYQLLIENRAINLGNDTTPLGEMCFRTTLSAGDKSTLALAFFLAQFNHDSQQKNLILVLDDPFSSQDQFRREQTSKLLKEYGKKCAQFLLLSHNPHFLNLVYSKLPKQERHSLQLSRTEDNTSTIEEWNIEKEVQDEYFKDRAELERYCTHGSKEDLINIVRKIRPVLEAYLEHRFPIYFSKKESLGHMISKIRNTGDSHPMYPELEELESIDEFSSKYHHDDLTSEITDSELKTYVGKTIEIMKR